VTLRVRSVTLFVLSSPLSLTFMLTNGLIIYTHGAPSHKNYPQHGTPRAVRETRRRSSPLLFIHTYAYRDIIMQNRIDAWLRPQSDLNFGNWANSADEREIVEMKVQTHRLGTIKNLRLHASELRHTQRVEESAYRVCSLIRPPCDCHSRCNLAQFAWAESIKSIYYFFFVFVDDFRNLELLILSRLQRHFITFLARLA
jgi:hypothetical protein